MKNQYMVMPILNKISNTWYVIFTGKNGIPTESVLSDDLKKAYEEAKAKITDKQGNPTSHYQVYVRYQNEWKSKKEALDKAYADACTDPMKLQQWPITCQLYQDDVNNSWGRWQAFGFKNEIENAMNILGSLGRNIGFEGNDLKKAIEDAEFKIIDKEGKPTPNYQAYIKYRDEWKYKVDTNEAKMALDGWISFGFKNEIEKALATLAAQGTDPDIAFIFINWGVPK